MPCQVGRVSRCTLLQSKSDAKALVKKKVQQRRREEWQSIIYNKLIDITDSIRLLPNSSCSNREWERVLCILRLGHTNLTRKHLMTRYEPPECETCQVPLAVKHIIVDCDEYQSQRRRYFPNYETNLKYYLSDSDTSYNGPLCSFVKSINTFDLISSDRSSGRRPSKNMEARERRVAILATTA